MPFSEAIFPDGAKNAWQNQRGFMFLYLLISAMIFLFVKETYFNG